MCTLHERITSLCKAKGVTGSRMCLELGLSKSTLSDIKHGRKKGISTNSAQKIADYLGVSVDYLLTGEEEQKNKPTDNGELSQKDVQLVNWFRSLPKETRQAILTLGAAPKGLDD